MENRFRFTGLDRSEKFTHVSEVALIMGPVFPVRLQERRSRLDVKGRDLSALVKFICTFARTDTALRPLVNAVTRQTGRTLLTIR